MDLIGWITDAAASLPTPLVWILGFLFSLAESGLGLGFFVPGETIVLLLAATFDSPLPAIVFFLVVALGGSAGDHVGYLLGRRFGTGFRDTRLIRRLGVDNWDRAVGVLERRGAAAVFLTRLVPVVRTLTPAAAGVARVPYSRFLPASFGGALTWASVYVGVGFLLRSSLDAAREYLGTASSYALIGVAVLVVVVLVVRAVRGKRTAPATGSADPADAPTAPAKRSTGRVALLLERLKDGRGWRTLPNALTAARIPLTLIAGALVLSGQAWPAAIVLLVVIALGAVDGTVARRTSTVSVLGGWLDPVADHLAFLLTTAALVLAGVLSWPELVALLALDALLALVALLGFGGDPRLPVWWAGRLRTTLLWSGALAVLVAGQGGRDWSFVVGLGYLVFLLGVVVHLIAAVHYARVMTNAWQQRVLTERTTLD